jgi:hypothetical protein
MRVDYTLPALQPGTLPELPSGPESTRPFREQLRVSAPELPLGWEQQLRLDARPFTGTYIGPPPRPQALQLSDPETQRARWRSMIWRHSVALDAGTTFARANSTKAIRTMLEMLQEMQEMEDSIIAQQVAVTRG